MSPWPGTAEPDGRPVSVSGPPQGPDFLNRTTREVLETLTGNQELIAALTGQWGDNGLVPDDSSFIIHALIARHYLYGGYYPVGGASKWPRPLSR